MQQSSNIILCLDLEGTLISNATSVVPRPGLIPLLEHCRNDIQIQKILIFTGLTEKEAEEVSFYLVKKMFVPRWFASIPIVKWHGFAPGGVEKFPMIGIPKSQDKGYMHPYKDLRFVQQMYSGENLQVENIYLVDNDEFWIEPGQKKQWIPIDSFSKPYDLGDRELERVWLRIKTILRQKEKSNEPGK